MSSTLPPAEADPVSRAAPIVARWWLPKLALTLTLIVYTGWELLSGPLAPLPMVTLGQALVVTGAAIHLYHYRLLKGPNRALDRPDSLVTRGGLLASIRHPMYLGDAIMVTGAAVLAGSLVGCLLLAACLATIDRLAREEDRLLAQAFPETSPAWRKSTRRLVPFLY